MKILPRPYTIALLSLMVLVLAVMIGLNNSEIRGCLGLDKNKQCFGFRKNNGATLAETPENTVDESVKKQFYQATIEQEVLYDDTRPKVKIKIGKIDNIPNLSNYKVALFVRPDDSYQVWDYQGNSLLTNKDIRISVEIDKTLNIKCFLYMAIIYKKDIEFKKYPSRYEEDKLQEIAINSNAKQSCFK